MEPPRVYKAPDVRQKIRYEKFEEVNVKTGLGDNSIEKYDYLIAFPLVEGATADPSQFGVSPDERITWEEARTIWNAAVPGTDQTKANAVAALAEVWKRRTYAYPIDTDLIRKPAWLTIARECILQQLQLKSGVQLKVTATSTYVLARIRAPLKLLEFFADITNYRLQLRGEVDPGSEEFWNREIDNGYGIGIPVELNDENVEYSKEEATHALASMYRAGKISPVDLELFTDVEVAATWSRRIHVLERVADKVPIWNRTPAYSPFTTAPNLRYLFEVYESCRGKTIFRPKDRLYLTKSILDKFFDLDMLRGDTVVSIFTALHDANRGESLTIDILKRRWVTFWKPDAHEVGAPMLTHPASEEDGHISWYLRPFSQPLGDIRRYFGEKIAFYYAWLGMYTYYLLVPAVGGLLVEIIYLVMGNQDIADKLNYFSVAFQLILVVWCVTYEQGWQQEQTACALKWGTRGFKAVEQDRPQFRGDPSQPLKRSEVTNVKQTFYPEEKRMVTVSWNYAIITIVLAINMGVFAAIFYAQYLIQYEYTEYYFDGQQLVVDFILSVTIVLSAMILKSLSGTLNDSENHRTDTTYENNLVAKTLLGIFLTNFSIPLFAAFGKGPLLGTCYESCFYDLRQLLYIIIIVRTVTDLVDIVRPYMIYLYRTYVVATLSFIEAEAKKEATKLGDEIEDNIEYMLELDREDFDGQFDDYANGVILYGYITFFSVALPMISLIVMVENMVKMRMDAFKMCEKMMRPHVKLAEDVGMWGDLMRMMSLLGIESAVGIICFTMQSFDEYSYVYRAIIFLAAQQTVIFFKFFVTTYIPNTLDWVEAAALRNKYICSKYVDGFVDRSGQDDVGRGDLKMAFEPEEFKLYDLRKSQPFTEDDYALLEANEFKKRELNKEFRLLKEQLVAVYKFETYNDNTGIGETKSGLPLGRLTAKVVELENLSGPSIPKHMTISVRIRIAGYRQTGTPAGPPIGPSSYSRTKKVDAKGNVSFNQVLGPFAPIRTQDADVIFEVINMHPLAAGASVAIASIKIRELLDQKSKNQVLNLKIRMEDGSMVVSGCRLFVSVLFQYSKVVPIRNRLYDCQDKIRLVEKEIQRIKDHK